MLILPQDQKYLQNFTYDEIAIGDSASIERTLTMEDIKLFAIMSGDVNPAHLDEEYAENSMFHKIIAHGMWGGALISTVLGANYPGPGTIYLSQLLKFTRPVTLGDTVTVKITATEKDDEKKRIVFDCLCTNQHDKAVIKGTAEVIAPTEKIRRQQVVLPKVRLADRYAGYKWIISKAEALPAIRMGVIHPVTAMALNGVVNAAETGLIIPTLIGPEARIRQVAETEKLDISQFELVSTEHSEAAAAKGVELARAVQVDALMRGNVGLQELMRVVVKGELGLRTARRMSHVLVMDVPNYERPLFFTDTSLTITPTLEQKRDIVQNAIDLAQILGIEMPKVAIVAALEKVDPILPSTIDAAALCKMAQRKQITGGVLDGPLAFDNIVSLDAASAKDIESEVAGKADILLVPNAEAGHMLAKQLEYLADGQAANIVMGARVPIILPGRADNLLSRIASCALASIVANQKQQGLEPKI